MEYSPVRSFDLHNMLNERKEWAWDYVVNKRLGGTSYSLEIGRATMLISINANLRFFNDMSHGKKKGLTINVCRSVWQLVSGLV